MMNKWRNMKTDPAPSSVSDPMWGYNDNTIETSFIDGEYVWRPKMAAEKKMRCSSGHLITVEEGEDVPTSCTQLPTPESLQIGDLCFVGMACGNSLTEVSE